MKKTRSFTLIEVLISTILIGIILFFLMSNLKDTTFFSRQMQKTQHKIFKEQYCDMRLAQVFGELSEDPQSLVIQKDKKHRQVLKCKFNNDLDRNVERQGALLATLYINDLKQLVLHLSNASYEEDEILLSDISSFELTAISKQKKYSTWDETELPEFLLITLNKTLVLPFELYLSRSEITL